KSCLESAEKEILQDLKGNSARPEHLSHLRSTLAATRNKWLAKRQSPPEVDAVPIAVDSQPMVFSSKGAIQLLQNLDGTFKSSVSPRTADEYLGMSARRRQQLTKEGALTTIGHGQNRQITVKSLLEYLPSEK